MQRPQEGNGGFVPSSGSPNITSPSGTHRTTNSRDSIEEILMPRGGGFYNPYGHAPSTSRAGVRPTADVNVATTHAYQYPSPVDSNSSRGRHVEFSFPSTSGQSRSARSASIPTPPEQGRSELAIHFPAIQSPRYPGLHFLLASDLAHQNNFWYDVRRGPRDNIHPDVFEQYSTLWVMRSRPVDIRIVSREFPWIIDIKASPAPENERSVTVGDVWNSLHQELLKPLTDADWALLTAQAGLEDGKALRRLNYLTEIATQQDQRGEEIALRRLDWLMRKTLFVGLSKDEGFQVSQKYILPGREQLPETWIAEFSERP